MMLSEVLEFPVTVFRSAQCWFPVVVAGLNASGETHTPPSFPTKIPRSWALEPTAKSKAGRSTWGGGAVNRRSAVGRAGEMRLGGATGENGRSLGARNDGKFHGVIAERLAKIGEIRGVRIDHAKGRSGAAAEDAAAREYCEQIIGSGGGIGDGHEQ